jgi:hypothetical protein
MTYYIGSVTNSSGSFSLAHHNMLEFIKESLDAIPSYTILRYVTSGTDHELIVKTTGLSGTEEIFFGFRTYHSVSSDYYNLLCATFIGYLAGNTFDTQPGIISSGVPAHNLLIDYFMTANEQRISLTLKIGSPTTYMPCIAGKFYPASSPSQYPNPLVNAGVLNGAAATRYSDTGIVFPFNSDLSSSYLRIRDFNGSWVKPLASPFSTDSSCGLLHGTKKIQHLNGVHPLFDLELFLGLGFLGWIDGVSFVSGFDNFAENVVQIGGSSVVSSAGKTTKEIVDEIINDTGGRAFVVLPNIYRSGFKDFVAMEMA